MDAAADASHSPSPSPPPSPPVTVAAPPPRMTDDAQPHSDSDSKGQGATGDQPQPVTSSPGPRSHGQGQGPVPPPREDCWSEGATWSLIEAWGERHRLLSRGSLRQKDWREVSEIVTSRENYTKPPKSESQCKNRIDTLKKKFKLESFKRTSTWPYLPRLRELLTGPTAAAATATADPAPRDPGSFKHQMQHLQLKKKRSTKKRSHRKILENFAPPPPPPLPKTEEENMNNKKKKKKKKRKKKGNSRGIAELTRAIAKLGEVYERVESGKLKQAAELERQRMGLARELELQRMEFFTKALLELTRIKPKPSS